VAIPRYILDRYSPVAEAVDLVGNSNFEAIAKMATKILFDKKGEKIRLEAVYTPEEVENILKVTSDTISLDTPIHDHDDDKEVHLGEILPSEKVGIEKDVESGLINKHFHSILKEHLNEEEYRVVSLRWALNTNHYAIRSLDQTTELYKLQYDNKMNKSKIRDIEARAIIKLQNKRLPELKALWDASEELIGREE
jgi:DNA-directed RNA polymerase sigma subunit (sigma70/sigma32)